MQGTPKNTDEYLQLSEEEIRADIQYFRERLDHLDHLEREGDHLTRARRTMYEVLFHQRRQLLAALRDGRPEQWPEYEPVGLDAGDTR